MPSLKLVAKERVGLRVSKRYDIDTPLHRLVGYTRVGQALQKEAGAAAGWN
ncbi:MAG: hypothetical protein ABIL25_10750 [candidate division WOR-3 bacterium]